MLTYQVRKRLFKTPAMPLMFPNDVEITLRFRPLAPFGAGVGDGRTAVKAVAGRLTMNANTGRFSFESTAPLKPLEITFGAESGDPELPLEVKCRGNELCVRRRCADQLSFVQLVESLYYGMPMLLNLEFADPPVVTEVVGSVGGAPFRWEIAQWQAELEPTTDEKQRGHIKTAFERMPVVFDPAYRRMASAMHYFHLACRLRDAGNSPWEFLGEIIINLAKVLEAIFPPSGTTESRDAARAGLRAVGYVPDTIENDFISILALRSEIDAAHVCLTLFSTDELEVLHQRADRAEGKFRGLLRKIVSEAVVGKWSCPTYDLGDARARAAKVIERLKRSASLSVESGGRASR